MDANKIKNLIISMVIMVFAFLSNNAVADGWTSSFSEEGKSHEYCRSGRTVKGIQCSGGYCDNLSLKCAKIVRRGKLPKVVKKWWTRSISEERRGGRDTVDGVVVRVNDNMQRCGTHGYITGMQCIGAYCDNIKLHCTTFESKKPRNCVWSRWISEENGGRLSFGPRSAVAMQCKGSYCDNKKFLICH